MRTHISIAFLKFIFCPLIANQAITRFITVFSLLKISQLHHRSQTPSSHTSTTKEPLLHNNIPAAATGLLERAQGHNSGPLFHPATRPNNAGTPSLPIMDKYVPQTNTNNAYIYTNSLCTRPIFVNEISSPPDFNGCIALLYISSD